MLRVLVVLNEIELVEAGVAGAEAALRAGGLEDVTMMEALGFATGEIESTRVGELLVHPLVMTIQWQHRVLPQDWRCDTQ